MFDFIGLRKYWYALSLLVIVPGLISLFIHGLNLGIDFTGGSILELRFAKPATVQTVRSAMDQTGLRTSTIQKTGTDTFIIRTQALSEQDRDKLFNQLGRQLGKVTPLSEDTVGPVIGKELTRNALLALIIASVLMVIYITVRFEFKFGVAAIIALLHDVLVTVGLFSIFRWQVDSTFVAAILTIIGYSINDTIVIFDRIRENLRSRKKGEELQEIINKSLVQTLARSINTVLTVIFVLVALLLFGGATIHVFVLAMLIGVISGAYSSIFNASPLWFDFKRGEGKTKSARA